jgi:diguanylate cyclase (GGDEF)-like protein
MSAEAATTRADPRDERISALEAEVAALRAEVKRLEALADHDILVPALNRRAFVRELGRTLAYCRRYRAQACVLYLDLDGFKSVNDRMGHPAGDAALIRVAELLTAQVRESDLVARLGGDEFGVLLQQANEEAAQAKALALAEAIAAEDFGFGGEQFRLGGSFGVRAYDGQDDPEAWLAEADAAMFVRKKDGDRSNRNRL